MPPRPTNAEQGWAQIVTANAALEIDASTIACEWDGTPVDYGMVVDHLVTVDGLA